MEYCSDLYLTAIGALIGIIFSAIFGILSLQDTNSTWLGVPHLIIYTIIIILCSVFLLLSVYYHIKIRKITMIYKKDILKEMNLIESRFENQCEDNSSYTMALGSSMELLGSSMADAFQGISKK